MFGARAFILPGRDLAGPGEFCRHLHHAQRHAVSDLVVERIFAVPSDHGGNDRPRWDSPERGQRPFAGPPPSEPLTF